MTHFMNGNLSLGPVLWLAVYHYGSFMVGKLELWPVLWLESYHCGHFYGC